MFGLINKWSTSSTPILIHSSKHTNQEEEVKKKMAMESP